MDFKTNLNLPDELEEPELAHEIIEIDEKPDIDIDNQSVFSVNQENHIKVGGDNEEDMLNLLDKIINRSLTKGARVAFVFAGLFTVGFGASAGGVFGISKFIY